jgi:ribosomal protein S18 acetylase RimI-like enzyme
VDVWACEDADGSISGFIGMREAQIEMLFVDPERFGQGIGTTLLDHARDCHANLTVDVNEQNPRAHALVLSGCLVETESRYHGRKRRPYAAMRVEQAHSQAAKAWVRAARFCSALR